MRSPVRCTFNEQYGAPPVSDVRVERLPAGAQTQRWATWLEPGFASARLYGIPAVRRLLDREPCDAMISVSLPPSPVIGRRFVSSGYIRNCYGLPTSRSHP